jgi:putative oxidoreductase
MKRLISTASLNTDLATLILRLIFGGMFILHGWPKLADYDNMLKVFGDPIHIGTTTSVILVIFAEFFCGIFILLGFLTRLSVIPPFIAMLVVYLVTMADQPFTNKMLPFVYLFLCAVLFISGSGKYSLDSVLFDKKQKDRAS